VTDDPHESAKPLPDPAGPEAGEPPAASGWRRFWHAFSAWLGDRSAGRSHVRLRRWLVGLLVVLAVLGVLVSSVTLWAHGVLLNTDKWVATVAPIEKDPQVQHNLSVYLAQRGVDAIDIQQRAENLLPSRLDPLAAPLGTAVEGYLQTFLQQNIAKFLATDTAYNLWVAVNRVGHEQVVNALQNKPGALSINNGQAQLNLLPLLSKALIQIQQRFPKLLPNPIPEISPATPPAQANAQLSSALRVTLPSDFGQVTLLKSPDLSKAQKLVRIFNAVVVILVILTIALIVAAVWLSLRRRRTLIELGVGVAVALIIAHVAVGRLEQNIVNGLKASGGPGIAEPTLRIALGNLQSFTLSFLIAGIVVAVAAFLVGKPHWFARAGHGVGKLGESGAGALQGHQSTAARFLVKYADWLRLAGIVVALLILLLATPPWGWIIAIVLILLAWELLIHYLVFAQTPDSTT